MDHIKRLKQHPILIIAACIVIGILGVTFFIQHRLTDHDIASVLLNPSHIPAVVINPHPALSQIKHVFVIVEENHDWSAIKGNKNAPFINGTLLIKGAYTSQYYNVPKDLSALHPSEPNYILMEAGRIAFSDHTFTTNDVPSVKNSTSSQDHFVKLLEKQGLTWKSYQEDISGTNCPIANVNKYAAKHNPYVFFQDITGNPPSESNSYCKDHNRPFNELKADLQSGNVPNYVFITPNLDNDMHDGSIAQADKWLSEVVPTIVNSKTFQQDGALFITWDEGNGLSDENNPIGMMMLSRFIKLGYTNSIEYSHVSYVKTIQEIFNISPLVGGAADSSTQDLSDFFQKH